MLKETNPEYSLEGLNAKAESPILWPHNAKSWFVGKDPDRGQDWGQEKGVTEDKMDSRLDIVEEKINEVKL